MGLPPYVTVLLVQPQYIAHLAIHTAVPSKSVGVIMLVSEATEAAQYALLRFTDRERRPSLPSYLL